MEKYTVTMYLVCIVVITNMIIIPLYEINALGKEKDNIVGEIQWCCSYQEDRNDNIHNLLISNSSTNTLFSYLILLNPFLITIFFNIFLF